MNSTHVTYRHYEYSPLQSNEIRLVQLHRGSFEQDLRFQIVHHSFDAVANCASTSRSRETTLPRGWRAFQTPEGRNFYWRQDTRSRPEALSYKHPRDNIDALAPDPSKVFSKFEALSYTWGDISDTQSALVVEDSTQKQQPHLYLRLGQNLTTALRHLRFADHERLLWIDALCINQIDAEERAAQVKRMRDIYKQAARVIVWLGESSQDSATALSLLQYLGQQIEISVDGWKFESFDPPAAEPNWRNPLVVLPYRADEWQAVESLFMRPWFDRLWVLQEVMANSETIVKCGYDSIDWYHLRRAVAALDERAGVPANLSYRLNGKVNIAFGSRTDLRTVVFIARQHLCQDPRDKLYGVFGLWGPELQAKISPSYERSAEEVYREVFMTHSRISGRLDLLTQCFTNSQLPQMPSWVPDWRSYPPEFRIAETGYQASGASKAEFWETSESTLQAIGILHDRIVKVFDAADAETESLINCIRHMQPKNIQACDYVTGEPMLKAWIRTLALDALQERFPERDSALYAEWERTVLGVTGNKVDEAAMTELDNASNIVRDTLTDMRFFTTEQGYFGFGPYATQTGDSTCVLLGAPTPLVLRPAHQGAYQVMGWSYIHGLMDSEILLGCLPESWIVIQKDVEMHCLPRYVNVSNSWWQLEDPRLWDAPEGWERIFQRQLTEDDPVVVDYFKNVKSGEIINHDPRMTAAVLRGRGIPLQTITFV